MLDDFANLQIPQIDNVLSIIRSRNIWATLLLQSTNQLDALYGEARARSIMGNCDTHLVLAFQDPESAPGVFRPRRRAAQHAHGDADRSLVALCTRSHSRTGRAL